MKLKEYIKKLQKIADENPNLTVVFASDEEANTIAKVTIDPVVGTFGRGDFTLECDPKKGPNAVLIN